MANIGTLSVALTATVDKFLSGFGKAQQKVEGFVRAIPGMNLVLSKTGAILGALAGGALVAYGRSVANSIDETAKLADRIGTSTEALVGLQHAAELAGGGHELLEQALQKLAVGLGKAAEDAGSAKEGLASLGLSVDDLLGKDPAEQFRVISERLSGLATQEEKAAAAANIFGKAGAELVNVLELGRAGLDAMQADAEKLGLTFSRVDAYKVEAANDALTRVGDTIRGVVQRAVIELAPYIEAASNAFVEWATSGSGAGQKVVDALRAVAKGVAVVSGVIEGLWGVGQTALGGLIFLFGWCNKLTGYLVTGLEKVAMILTLGFVNTDFGDRMREFADSAIDLGKAWMDSGVDKIKEGWGGERVKQVEEFFDGIQKGAQDAAVALKDAADKKKALQDSKAAENAGATPGPSKKEEKEAEQAAKRLERERDAMEEKAATAERIASMSAEERKWQSEILEIEEARKKGWDDLADRMQQVLEARQKEKAADDAKEKAEDLKKQTDQLRAQVEQRLRIQEMSKADREYADEIIAAEDARRRGLTDIAGNLEKIVALKRAEADADKKKAEVAAAEEKSRQELERKKAVQEDLLLGLTREIELLSAANDLERERIQIRHELEDRIKAAGDNLEAQNKAEEAAALKQRQAEKDAADRAAKESQKAGGRGGRGRRGREDDFGGDGERGGRRAGGGRSRGSPWSGFGGTSFGQTGGGPGLFGTAATKVNETRLFGVDGPTVSQWEAMKKKKAEAAAKKAAEKAPAATGPQASDFVAGGLNGMLLKKGGGATAAVEGSTGVPAGGSAGAKAAGEKLPDPTPKIDEASKQLGELRESWGKVVTSIDGMATKVGELAGDVKSGADKTAETEKRVGDEVADAKAALDRLKEALEAVQQAVSGG